MDGRLDESGTEADTSQHSDIIPSTTSLKLVKKPFCGQTPDGKLNPMDFMYPFLLPLFYLQVVDFILSVLRLIGSSE